MSPEEFEEFGPDDGYDDDGYDHQEDAAEWQPGECDMCAGPPKTDAEKQAALASGIVPVCACWVGQGAPQEECLCSPALFDDQTGEGVKK